MTRSSDSTSPDSQGADATGASGASGADAADARRDAKRAARTAAAREAAAPDVARPADAIDGGSGDDGSGGGGRGAVAETRLGPIGWLRFGWRQLTSMRTALLLLLLLAIAAVPGSLVPQRSSDPNGVTQYFADNPDLASVLDWFQMFDVYSSVWFSSVYLLLFVSLVGCIIPRTKHHWQALRARPPRTPARLGRLAGYTERTVVADADSVVGRAAVILKKAGYRVERYELRGQHSVSAERGYWRETGNLVFHTALLGILVTVGIGSGFGFAGQRVLVEGQSFVNTLQAYDSFNPGRFVDENGLDAYRLGLVKLDTTYEVSNKNAIGQPTDFTAHVEVQAPGGAPEPGTVKVNGPLRTHGTDVYLLGNGYAPTVTIRDPEGTVVFDDTTPFLPQTAELTSIGVLKVPDGLAEQIGLICFFYPTQDVNASGAYSSTFPDLIYPVLTCNTYAGDLGLDEGVPTSVYELDTSELTQIGGRGTDVEPIELMPGESTDLPDGLGTITFEDASEDGVATEGYGESVKRFASFDIHHDPTQRWVLVFAILLIGGLVLSLFVPRRRVWVKAVPQADGTVLVEYAGLARGEDPTLESAVANLADKHAGGFPAPETTSADGAAAGADD